LRSFPPPNGAEQGGRVRAIVRLGDGVIVSAEEITAHGRSLIAEFKCPRSVEFRAEPLPLSPSPSPPPRPSPVRSGSLRIRR
jgi:hypothetical protein